MLIAGFLSDLPHSRTDLLVENALLRQQLIVLNRHVKEALKSASLPDIRVHDLRHSQASLLLASGVNTKLARGSSQEK